VISPSQVPLSFKDLILTPVCAVAYFFPCAVPYLCAYIIHFDRLCGLVVSVEDYKHSDPGFESRALLRIFLRELVLERGPLSLVIR
jgi:hypothetical protein